MTFWWSRSQQFKIFELKPRAYAATHKAVLTFRTSGLPMTCRNGMQRMVKGKNLLAGLAAIRFQCPETQG